MISSISKEQFIEFFKQYQLPNDIDFTFLYDVYETSVSGISELNNSNFIGHINGINQYDLINYCFGEYIYLTSGMKKADKERFISKEENVSMMASIVADKYLSLSMFNYQEKKVMNKYLPPISTMNLYLNFMLNILNNYEQNEPRRTLIRDLLSRSISIARCILSLLVDGYVTEAYATWRTLHECECTLVLLEKYGEPLINSYLKHMKYAIAYKGGKNKEETDAIFVEIKEGMAEHALKSKDMKKYIEYGWLYTIEEFNNNPLDYKLNFKDGLEKISGVKGYGESYNMASEIVHATPMLIYPNKDYFYYVTLLSIYEAFFRLESSFVNLFTKHISKENIEAYAQMRKVYYAHIMNIYRREKEQLIARNIKR